MRKIFYWFFSKTKLGKVVDGHKREIGFALWLIGWLIQGAAQASGAFPEFPVLLSLHEYLILLQQNASDLLKDAGITTMVVGVGADAIKQNVEKARK